MSRRSPRAAIACGALLCTLAAFTQAEPQSRVTPSKPAYIPPPYVVAQQFLFAGMCAELDRLAAALAESDSRDEDGQPELMSVTEMLGYRLVPWTGDDIEQPRQHVQNCLKANAQSPFAPILEAVRLRGMAWRARGEGFASQVAPEGWEIFHEQSMAAWKLLMKSRQQSSGIPSWYQLAIATGSDAGIPEEKVRALFIEGKKRFPTFYGIYFHYMRKFAPRWGGTFEEADVFIRSQANSKANRDGDVLYTRLYWSLDMASGTLEDFFQASRVDWARMRRGFEMLLEQYPKSEKNATVFGVYACRARDAAAYQKMRPMLTGINLRQWGAQGYSVEVCDRRVATKSARK